MYASNGGAMLIMFSAKDKNAKVTVPGTVLEVKNSNFTGCTSTTTETSNRLGGGAIVTNAETMTMDNCYFENCTAIDQAGAVFHRVDANYNSWTNITNCTFVNCSANAAGGLELDSKNIEVSNCTFEHCVAKERNGGGFNAYMLNNSDPTADCWITLTNCTFNDCQAYKQNGGGFRSTAVYTTVKNCSFTNTSGNFGGGIAASNKNTKETKVFGCTFDRCTASNQGGGLYTLAAQVEIGDYTSDDGEIVHTSINNCTSANEGGGVYHARDMQGSSLTITNATITGNQTKNNSKSGGGVFTNARTVSISGSTITDNTCTSTGGGVYANTYTSLSIADSDISRNIAPGNGGGVYFYYNGQNNTLTVKGSTINGNTSNGDGGGIYTQAKTVTIGDSETRTDTSGKPISSSISGNTAKNGGGIYHNRNVEGSSLTITNASINDNTANTPDTNTDRGGGAIFAIVRTLDIATTEISRNSSTRQGGAIYFDIYNNDGARQNMRLTLKGCTLDTNTAGGNGGAIYTSAYSVEIVSYTKEEDVEPVTTATTISNCTAASSGGGLYHNQNGTGSALAIQDTRITGCSANDSATNNAEHGGGGIFANVRTTTVKDSEISGNSAVRNGGGILALSSEKDRYLKVDHSNITGNTSGNQGGGIYTRSQLTLRNGTEITGNHLTTNTAANAAGVYIENNRTLFVGVEDADSDTVYVKENYTADGSASNLRLWENGTAANQPNNPASVYVYCNLDGEIRVVNAKIVGAQFGSSEIAKPDGFTDDFSVFKADASTLHGITDRNDSEGKKIIWAGPPIAKITDRDGKLLFLKSEESEDGTKKGTYPAIFDRLGTGYDTYSNAAAFNMLCTTETPPLYKADGTLYEGNAYCIKMLDNFETPAYMYVQNVPGRTITFTTAGKDKDKEDGYPFKGSGTRATVTRSSSVNVTKSTLNAYGNLILENIVLDGGSQSGVPIGNSTRCMWVESGSNAVVSLGENALLQNGTSNGKGGGGVYIQSGTLNIQGGIIRNCTANNGGGIYENGGTLMLSAGNIFQCTATGNGGGVYENSGSFTISGGTISNGSAALGAGVYVANSKTFNMSGGSIINNEANTTGGGIAIGGNGTRLNFSGKVTVSGNTATKGDSVVA